MSEEKNQYKKVELLALASLLDEVTHLAAPRHMNNSTLLYCRYSDCIHASAGSGFISIKSNPSLHCILFYVLISQIKISYLKRLGII